MAGTWPPRMAPKQPPQGPRWMYYLRYEPPNTWNGSLPSRVVIVGASIMSPALHHRWRALGLLVGLILLGLLVLLPFTAHSGT